MAALEASKLAAMSAEERLLRAEKRLEELESLLAATRQSEQASKFV